MIRETSEESRCNRNVALEFGRRPRPRHLRPEIPEIGAPIAVSDRYNPASSSSGTLLRSKDISTVEAQVSIAAVTAEIRKLHLTRPISNRIYTGGGFWIDMSLTGRNGNPRVRYEDRWHPRRFEKIGSIMALCGNGPIHGISDPDEGTSVVCRILPEAARRWIGDQAEWTDEQLAGMLDVSNEGIKSLMTRLAIEVRNPGFAGELMIELIAGQLLIELHRSGRAASQMSNGGLAPWQLRAIEARLRDAIHDVTLTDIASLCGISVRHLTRAFRVSQGCSIGSYLSRIRMEQAKSGLIAGESIKVIAPKLGFSSVSSFTSAFRRDVGVSPAAFRSSFR